MSKKAGNVQVLCRFRPMNQLEKTNGNQDVATFTSPTSLTFHSTKEKNEYKFNFDQIFDPSTTQEKVYDYGVKEIIDSVLCGYNGTVLAYGQTSSGKTYTMQGIVDSDIDMGIIPRMINHVFRHIYDSPPENEFTVKVSMVEIYQEKIRDLVDTSKVNLNIREDPNKGIYIEDVSEHYVGGPEEVVDIIKIGTENRAQAATNMNEHSSRSHSILIMTINQNNKKEGSSKTGKLYLVDLAGSEKISKTGAKGTTLEEAKIINKSLTTLGMVINSLTDGKSKHIPYRESKLTRVLQESLGGNSKTCLIITCSPSIYNESETLSTLRFGERAKKIKNKPKINKEVTVAELQNVIKNLESQLAKANRRITQLESYIKSKGLPVPPSDDGFVVKDESEDGPKKKVDEELIRQYKAEMEKENATLQEKIIDVISSLKDTEEGEQNKNEMIAQLLIIKENSEKKESEDSKKIESLKNELEMMTKAKNELQTELIKKESIEEERKKVQIEEIKEKTEKEKKESEAKAKIDTQMIDFKVTKKELEGIKETTVEFVNTLKKKVNETNVDWLYNLVNEYQTKLSTKSKIDFNSSDNVIMLKPKKKVKEEDTQTDNSYEKNEIEKATKKFENEKLIYLKAIDEKGEKLSKVENEYSDLNERYKALYEKIPFNSKKNIERLLAIEKNLVELAKKLKESQTEKLLLETTNQKMVKVIKEKCEALERWEKEGADKSALIRSTMVGNVVRVIKGGHNKGASILDARMDIGKSFVK